MTINRDELDSGDQQTLAQARVALDESLDELSPEVLEGLREARLRALASVRPRPAIYRLVPENRWVWGGALAAGLAVLAVTSIWQDNPELLPTSDAESLLALAELNDTEWQLVQDELEFAYWLSELEEEAFVQENPG